MGFIDDIKAKAKTCKKTIVLPETEDIRTYEAAEAVIKEGTANIILIGSEEEIAKKMGISVEKVIIFEEQIRRCCSSIGKLLQQTIRQLQRQVLRLSC